MSLIASSVVAIAQVEPLTTTRRLSGPFDYALPAEPLEVGSVVRVPFGHQRLDGVVVGLAEASELPPERLVAPSAVREDSVPPDLVALALWMAAEYASTPARALSLVLPPRGKPRTRLWARRTAASLEGERLTERQRALLAALPGPAGAALGSLRRLEARGLVALEPRAERREPLTRPPADRAVQLTAEQAAALDAVAAGGAHLLHGVTGSGKTEVYLRAAEAALARGRGRDRARARDRADPADGRALPGPLRRHGRGAALGAGRGRALRRVAAAALGRGADRGRAALGGLRARRAARARGRRRGARRLLQARGRPALRRPPRRRRARAARGRARCSPARRRRGRRRGRRCRG